MTNQTIQTEEADHADDERRFRRLKSMSSYAELPGIDTAMWPGDVELQLDVSEYNDRYIRMPLPTQLMYLFYLVSCWNTFGFIMIIIMPLWGGTLAQKLHKRRQIPPNYLI